MKKILFLSFGLLLLLNACVKKDDTKVGEAKVKFVNAVSGSEPQDAYVNGSLMTAVGVGYGQSTDYLTYYSGINSIAFADRGTMISNAIINYGTDIDSYATIYYYKTLLGGVTAGAIRDDMTAPPAGKARVRFVHLNNFLNNSLAVKAVDGAQLFPVLVFASASAYFDVEPGTKFQASATGVTTAPEINIGVQSGKIYTIILTGTAATELNALSILQN